jgi:oligopeptide transport system permease protein
MAGSPASVPAAQARVVPLSPVRAFLRSTPAVIGLGYLTLVFLLCVATLPFTLIPRALPGSAHLPEVQRPAAPAYDAQSRDARHLPPVWWTPSDAQRTRLEAAARNRALADQADAQRVTVDALLDTGFVPSDQQVAAATPRPLLGTDLLGRDLLARVAAGGGISLAIGLCAALISVLIGTLYGAIAGYVGGRVDGVMMRIVDILYGLPYILLVVLLAVASDALLDEYISKSRAREAWVADQAALVLAARSQPADASAVRKALATDAQLRADLAARADAEPSLRRGEISETSRTIYDVVTLLVAIGGVSWLTMARVIRGQVLSLKNQPFVEAARAVGCGRRRIFLRHLLPNILGPIIVYATLTVPQAILQESFLSFLGIGVKPPLPSWGNLAADGLDQLNLVQSYWWLLVFPCLLLGTTLLALNFVGEGLREAFDPRRSTRR